MTEILLVRHAKSYANLRDFTAFGNVDSPLEPVKGIPQALALRGMFREVYGIDPESYELPVLSSEYRRAVETAEVAGFNHIELNPLLNEATFDRGGLSPEAVVLKHARERWVPESVTEEVTQLIESMRSDSFGHRICFSHGVKIAGVKMQLVDEAVAAGQAVPFEFIEGRGYIPDQATITPVRV